MGSYYLARCRIGHEHLIIDQLVRNNITALVAYPTMEVIKTRRFWRRSKSERVPAFPGYVFIQFSSGHSIFNYRKCPSLVSLVRYADKFATVTQEFIDDLLQKEIKMEDCKRFKPGDLVSIIQGPLKGLVGRVEKCPDDSQEVVLSLKNGRMRVKILSVFIDLFCS